MLLSPGREAMAARALASIQAQTYPRIEVVTLATRDVRGTIGAMRNAANARATGQIIAHFDDDDWSHPRRIAEQVALLQAGAADCVGYNEALFWDTRGPGEAWVYRCALNFSMGASMCYWRRAWESCPFDDAPHEDNRWWRKNHRRIITVSARVRDDITARSAITWSELSSRIICEIHGCNTERYDPAEMARVKEWRRAPEYDVFCREIMSAKIMPGIEK
jgi:glycosyltransferase involved in cell wall biosynthesis